MANGGSGVLRTIQGPGRVRGCAWMGGGRSNSQGIYGFFGHPAAPAYRLTTAGITSQSLLTHPVAYIPREASEDIGMSRSIGRWEENVDTLGILPHRGASRPQPRNETALA